jgi:hypothetical protein
MRIVEDGVAGRMIGAARAMGCGEGTSPGWRAPRVTRIVTDPACVITDLPAMAMRYRRRAPLDGAPCPSLGGPGTRPKRSSNLARRAVRTRQGLLALHNWHEALQVKTLALEATGVASRSTSNSSSGSSSGHRTPPPVT